MIAMRRWIGPLGMFAFLLVGCAGGGGPAQRAEQPVQAARPVQSGPVPKGDVKAPATTVADAPAIQTTQATAQPRARPVRPAVADQPVAIAPPPVPPAPARSACKVRKNVVEWVYVSGGCRNGY